MSVEYSLILSGQSVSEIKFSKDWKIREVELLEAVKSRQNVINDSFNGKIKIYLSPPMKSIDRVGYQLVVSTPYLDEETTLEDDWWHDVLRIDLAEFDYPSGKIPVKLCQYRLEDGVKYETLDGIKFDIEPEEVISYLDNVISTGESIPTLPTYPGKGRVMPVII